MRVCAGRKQVMTPVQKRPLLFMECLDTEIIGDYVCLLSLTKLESMCWMKSNLADRTQKGMGGGRSFYHRPDISLLKENGGQLLEASSL